ncbi:MAG: ABC transporter permease [Acidimicrobiales bacterium]
MTRHLAYLVLGSGAGAAIALLACGVMLTQRASGVVNFAHAATGMYLAHVFYEFRETGDVVLPIVGLPARVHLLPRPTVATALFVVAVYAALLAALIHTLVFRRLRDAPPLGRVVASIGLFLYLWAMVRLRFPHPPAMRRILPSRAVQVFGHPVFQDRLWSAVIAAVVIGAVWAVSRFTRFGLATTAAAESAKGAALTGIDADGLALVNWVLATMTAALAVVLVAPVDQLDPLALSLLIVPALAACLLGGNRSFLAVAVAAFAIGMAQSEIVNLQVSWPSVSGLGLPQALPFVVILATLVARRRSLPGRGEPTLARLPRSAEPRHVTFWLIASGVAAALVMLLAGSDWRSATITSAIATVLSLSVVVLTGYVGQISLAPFAFAGVAAFALTRLSSWGWPFPVAPLAAVLLAAVLGTVIGLPATKVRGMNLAIATLGAAVAIEQLLFKWRPFVGAGARGATEPHLFGADLGIAARGDAYPRAAFGILVIVITALAAVTVANLRRGRTGLAWLAVRSNERAAAAAGIDVRAVKLGAFALSSVLAGVGGVLLTYQHQTIGTDSFAVFLSLAILATTYLAGIASVSGAILAGVIAPLGLLAVAGGQDVAHVSPYTYVVNGALLVVAAVAVPSGITGTAMDAGRRLAGRLRVTSAAGGERSEAGRHVGRVEAGADLGE